MGINKLKILKTAKTKLNNEIQLIATSEIAKNIPLVIGVFHGDEPQGKFLIEEYLNSELNQTHLLFIPCLNPDGMELKKRTNSNNVDLNRNFPTKNWGENKGDNATCDDCENGLLRRNSTCI
jgi:protein MpaA